MNAPDHSGLSPLSGKPLSEKLKVLRDAFLSGLLLLLPLWITLLVINVLLGWIGDPVSRFLFGKAAGNSAGVAKLILNCFSTFVVLVFITVFGYFSRHVMGKLIISYTESAITRVPFIRTVYNTTREVVNTIRQQQQSAFSRVVTVEFGRPGTWVIGFLTNEETGTFSAKMEKRMVAVFVPTTPNPTSGFLFFVPESNVIVLDMTVAEGMKAIISGGAIMPGDGGKPVAPADSGSNPPA